MVEMASRDFNQKTNIAKKQAESEPVFITRQGKATHVLLSIRDYESLRQSPASLAEMLACDESKDVDFDPGKLAGSSLAIPDFAD